MLKYKEGMIVDGIVSGIEKYGIFVKLDDTYSGLIHISEVSHNFVRDITHFVTIGEAITVEILEIDPKTNQLKLSIKNLEYRKKTGKNRKKIEETSLGFSTLKKMLPTWIDKNLKK